MLAGVDFIRGLTCRELLAAAVSGLKKPLESVGEVAVRLCVGCGMLLLRSGSSNLESTRESLDFDIIEESLCLVLALRLSLIFLRRSISMLEEWKRISRTHQGSR